MPTAIHPGRTGLTAQKLARMSPDDRRRFRASLTSSQQEELIYRWWFWARDEQLAPVGDWRTWLLLAGRGFGKTRTGAEWIRQEVTDGRRGRLALIARTSSDARDVIVEGESGILRISPPWFRPIYNPSKRRLTWPNGAVATLYSADEPDLLRGPEHDGAWCDEVASWRYSETWDMLMFGLRLGPDPRVVVTTTPRATALVRQLRDDPHTAVTRGTSYDNRLNLAAAFFDQIVKKYEGTRLGRQELLAEVLEDNPNALWRRTLIEEMRIREDQAPPFHRVLVAIDPSVHDGKEREKDPVLQERAEAGIVSVGVARVKDAQKAYVLGDHSTYGAPVEWAREAVRAYHRLGADRIVAEVNNGGTMVEHTIRSVDRSVSYKEVRASRGKVIRAEPVSALYERGLVHHVGAFPRLEDEMCEWMPGEKSPNRMDALVWALTEALIVGKNKRLRRH